MDEELILRQTGAELQADLDKVERLLEIRSINSSLSLTNGVLSTTDVLPARINNRFLHTNQSTGVLEWVEIGSVDIPLIFTDWTPES